MTDRIVICGAGFGGMELAARLTDSFTIDEVAVTLIDKSDGFVFGYSKFDVMFGKKTTEEVTLPYRSYTKDGVDFRNETITAIDPTARRVTTDGGSYDADILVIALGATYDPAATPGLVEGGYEFYSVEGAQRAGEVLRSFGGGKIVIGVLGMPFKCPPAPYECALLTHDLLETNGLRASSDVHLITPMSSPIPVSESVSGALLAALAERNIRSTHGDKVSSLDPSARTAALQSGGSVDYDLFLAIPVHKAPAVVLDSGMCADDGWIPVDQRNMRTNFDGVYALGDVASAPVPRAGVFAETAARSVHADIVARLRGTTFDLPFDGTGLCYIEFGGGAVGMVDANFLGGPQPTASLVGPSADLAKEKAAFSPTRFERWFK
jgi:sulfide:quinone oxidoreductase